jgi:gluconokinase
MGVAGCGRSSLASAAASQAGLPLIEGDEFHSAASIAKIRAGIPLADADRAYFLDIDRNTALERVLARMDRHPFPASLVDSQFAALERPTGERGVLTLCATDDITVLCGEVLQWLVRTLS